MRERLPGYQLFQQDESEPIVLAGEPGQLIGELPLVNAGEELVVLRQATLRGSPAGAVAAGAATVARQLPDMVHTLFPVVMRAYEARRVPLVIEIARQTPPGEYRGAIDVGGHERPLVVHVAEVVEVAVSPGQLVVPSLPGDTITKRIVCTNNGNVPVHIDEIGAVPLDDERFECRTLRAALNDWSNRDGETQTIENFVTDVGRQARRTLDQAGLLWVHNTAGSVTLAPGETRPFDLEIRVPSTLARNVRYFGSAPIYTSDLHFVIVPVKRGREPEPKEPKIPGVPTAPAKPPPAPVGGPEGRAPKKAPPAKAGARKRPL